MITIENQIEGVKFLDLKQIGDERGNVLHMLRNDEQDFTQFGECYFSEIFPGAIKAWKKHTVQTQNIAVPIGRIRLVIYDNREFSLTNGQLNIIELGRPDANLRVRIPPGVWYGFKCIGLTTAMLVNCADYPHSKNESEVLNFDSTVVPYEWIHENQQRS